MSQPQDPLYSESWFNEIKNLDFVCDDTMELKQLMNCADYFWWHPSSDWYLQPKNEIFETHKKRKYAE